MREQLKTESFKQASQSRGRKMKCLQLKWSLCRADEAGSTQAERRAVGARLWASDGAEEALKCGDACSEPCSVKAQPHLSGLRRIAKPRLL